MISKDNYGEDHIKQLQLKSRKDPQLILCLRLIGGTETYWDGLCI